MKSLTSLVLVFVFCFGNSQVDLSNGYSKVEKSNILNKKPQFFNLAWEDGVSYTKEQTHILIEIDSIDDFNLELFVDAHKQPFLYSSSISTPVCADGECKLMHIDLFWSILGGYVGFNTYKTLPLTKHDHDEFLEADYLKLHQLLSDDKSILKKRKINQLVEKPEKTEIHDVDALSGATVAEVKESVVEGALYSCYVAWHLANGKVKNKIKSLTDKNATEASLLKMLYNDNPNYQMYALKQIDITKYETHNNQLAQIFKTSTPLVRGFIIKSVPNTFWKNTVLQQPFWNAFSSVDINSKTLLLNHLEDASNEVIIGLSSNLEVMSKNQTKLFLNFLEDRKLSKSILKNLKHFESASSQANSYLVEQFLKDL